MFGVILVCITPYLSIFSLNAKKRGKNVGQNNSEYGHFLRSVGHCQTSVMEILCKNKNC